MARPGSWARAQAREQPLSFMREHWRTIVLLSLGYAAAGSVVVVAGGWPHPVLRSYLVGGVVVGYGWVHHLVPGGRRRHPWEAHGGSSPDGSEASAGGSDGRRPPLAGPRGPQT